VFQQMLFMKKLADEWIDFLSEDNSQEEEEKKIKEEALATNFEVKGNINFCSNENYWRLKYVSKSNS